MDLSICIVNWNSSELLRQCLASIEATRGDLELQAIVVSEHAAAGIMIDGQIAVKIYPGDKIFVHRSPLSILLAASSGKSYFELLRTKLNWGRR